MKKVRFLATLFVSAMLFVGATITAFAESAPAVDLDGTYNAYIGVQSQSYIFRNGFDEATYGKGVVAEDGTVWFDQLTGWEGNVAIAKAGTFNDTVIEGNGTYSVSITDFDFGADEFLNLLFVSTDIPLSDEINFSDVKVKMDGSTKHTFEEAYINPDSKEYENILAINIWNADLGDYENGIFGYLMPTKSIELEFTVSGFSYDKPIEETTTTPEETTTTTPEETTTTTAAETTTTTAAADDSDDSGSLLIPILIAAGVVVVIVAVVIVVAKKKKA